MPLQSNTFALLLTLAGPLFAPSPCPPDLLSQAAKVATLRQVSAGWRPQCQVLPFAALGQRLEKKLGEELPVPPQLYIEVLQRLGFVSPVEGLYGKLLDFYSSQVLGFYEPQDNTMVIVDRPSLEMEKSPEVWLHEFAHAAQESRFRLPSKLMAVRENSDLQRALSAIAEGEAMLVMLTLASPTPPDVASLRRMSEAIAAGTQELAKEAGVGDFFVQDLAFPYAQGLQVVLDAFQRHGWSGVDALLAQPLTCTAALLFGSPCRHLDNRVLPPTPPGFEPLLTDTLGGWAMRFWLTQQLGQEKATALASAWAGDRLRILRLRKDPTRWAMVWDLKLTSSAKATEVATALRQIAPQLLAGFQRGTTPTIRVETQKQSVTLLVDWPTARP